MHKWRKTIDAEKTRKLMMNGPTQAKKGAASSPASSQAGTPSSATPIPAAKGYTGDPLTRKWTTDGVDMKRIGVPSRDGCAGLIYNGLAFVS